MRGTCFLFLAVLIIGSASASARVSGNPTRGNALIMSSIDNIEPFGSYGTMIAQDLQRIGYTVTMLKNTQVTLDLLMSGLNNYDIIIWQTDVYQWAHRTYYYVGEVATQTARNDYANDFANFALDYHAGVIGVNMLFFQEYFTSQSLSNVKLAFLLFSQSDSVASEFMKAGAQSVIFCVNDVSPQFGLLDDLATQVVAYLAQGDTLNDAVYSTITPYLYGTPLEDPLDSTYAPPFWYLGSGSLTVT
ncbi:MAG TPA: hypothetical protein VK503_05780 [Candidatus Bathyarchaeia archaeon]|nr:hypothetical protein [Candidatus Bathyarchaeia archaeon]